MDGLWKLSTPLSNFEAGSNYKDVQDPAVTVRVKVLEGLENLEVLENLEKLARLKPRLLGAMAHIAL